MSAAMRFAIFYFTLFAMHSLSFGKIPTDPELTANFFEGDMQLNSEQRRLFMNEAAPARNVLMNRNYRWPNKIVLYRISAEFSPIEMAQIQKAMLHIELQTCVRFKRAVTPTPTPTTTSSNTPLAMVVIVPDAVGCTSSVGYQGRLQHITLVRGSSCFRLGSIVHELLHTLGFYHQQSAADRDRYVRIHSANVQAGKAHNFVKLARWFVSDFGVSYDYASVMHYNAFAFTRNGQPTIEALDQHSAAAALMGQRMGLSAKDVLKINRMYAC